MKTNKELFEIVEALHTEHLGPVADELLKTCRLAMENMPDADFTRDLLNVAVDTIVSLKDAAEVDEQKTLLSTEEKREIFEMLNDATDEQIQQLAELQPEYRELFARLLFLRDEARRLAEDALRSAKQMDESRKPTE